MSAQVALEPISHRGRRGRQGGGRKGSGRRGPGSARAIALVETDFGRARAARAASAVRYAGRSEGGAAQVEVSEVVLGLVGAGRGHGDLDPAHALALARWGRGAGPQPALSGQWAPIFNSLSRIVPQVAVANWVWRRPIRRKAASST
jgi:hypothetical protein